METVPDTARAGTRLCRTWMRRASLLAAAMAGVALLAAACGGSSPGPSQSGQHKSAVAYAACMRAHGITNFPDPTSKGLSLGNGVDPRSPQFKAAGQACQSLLPNSAGGTHSQTGGSGGGS